MGGSCSCTCVPVPPPEAPAQLLIQVVNIWPQALGSLSQQLCPPLTLTTMREVDGCCRLTTVLACAYARFTSSLRAKFGICAGEVALLAMHRARASEPFMRVWAILYPPCSSRRPHEGTPAGASTPSI